MIDEENRKKNQNKLATNQMDKSTLISRIAIWSFSIALLFFVVFFVKTKNYQNSIPVNAAGGNKNATRPMLGSNDMKKREDKVKPASASEAFNPYKKNGKKVAFLTFDDGPSANNTPQILSILKKNKINATFFVIGNLAQENSNLVKREYLDGNTIGNHTYSHVYNHVYSSTQAFEEEIRRSENILKSILGDSYKTKLIRFPGGSFGSKLKPFRDVIFKDGYHYVDWNALDGDAEGTNIPADKLFLRLKETVGTQTHVVILMHDAPAKNTTVQILPQIIQYLRSKGYSFSTLQ